MRVTDAHVAFVRGLVWDGADEDELARLTTAVRQEGTRAERVLELFVQMVFVRAARWRFDVDATHGDIIRYVARARTGGLLKGEQGDIRVPERLLREALGDQGAADGLTAYDSVVLAPVLADLLHRELALDETGFHDLIDEARERTERAAELWSSASDEST